MLMYYHRSVLLFYLRHIQRRFAENAKIMENKRELNSKAEIAEKS